MNYKEQITCKLCYSADLTSAINLGETPLANEYADSPNIKQNYYPLGLMLCNNCNNVQLRYLVDSKIIFDDYVYVTGSSPGLVSHFQKYAESIQEQIKENAFICEIGSSDGTLLEIFKKYEHRVLGIEPGKLPCKISNDKSIDTISSYFTSEVAKDIRQRYGEANLVIANNVMAHIENIHDVVDGVKILLEDNGLFTMEVQYLRDVVEKQLIDIFYHEHVFIHSIKSLAKFFTDKAMKIEKVERIPTHGGSIRLYVRNSIGIHDKSVIDMITEELLMKLHDIETFKKLSQNTQITGSELRGYVRAMKDENKKIFGYGCPAKMCTLVHFLNIPKVEAVFDDNPNKVGKYTPGQHIPIISSKELSNKSWMSWAKPDVIIIFAWNEKEAILRKLKELEYTGRIIIPMPTLEIL